MLEEIKMKILPSHQSSNTEEMKHITSIINESFKEAEKGIWSAGTTRTSVEEITKLTQQGEMAVAVEEKKEHIVGCAHIQQPDTETGEIGMLAVDRAYQGHGIASKLIQFAEKISRDKGRFKMQLEVLMPEAWDHPNQLFLKKWYQRLGYQQINNEALSTTFPELTPMLAVPCQLIIFQKELE